LDSGKSLPNPDSLLINGQKNAAVFTGLAGNHFNQQTPWLWNTHHSFRFPFKLELSMVINFGTLKLFSGKTYKFRVSNVGLSTSFNFRIQGHDLKLIEVEGAHTMMDSYSSIDVHVGQSFTVLVTLKGPISDYAIIASTRFTGPIVLTTTATLRYAGSNTKAPIPLPQGPPTNDVQWSMQQARTIRYYFFIYFTKFISSKINKKS